MRSAITFGVLGAMLWLSLATFAAGGGFGLAGGAIGLLIGLQTQRDRFWSGVIGCLLGFWIGLGVAGLAMG